MTEAEKLAERIDALPPVWAIIPGWVGFYEASDSGEIRSVDRTITTKSGVRRFVSGTTLKPYLHRGGYWRVMLCRPDGKNLHIPIHRLVATALIPNPDDLPAINHINGEKTDNRVTNLEWCTFQQNAQHCAKSRLNPALKLTDADVLEARRIYQTGAIGQRALAAQFGVTRGSIRDVVLGRSYSWVGNPGGARLPDEEQIGLAINAVCFMGCEDGRDGFRACVPELCECRKAAKAVHTLLTGKV